MKFRIRIASNSSTFSFDGDGDNLDDSLNVLSIYYLLFGQDQCFLFFKAPQNQNYVLENFSLSTFREDTIQFVLDEELPIPLFDIYCKIKEDNKDEFSKLNINQIFNNIKADYSFENYLIYKFCYYLEQTLASSDVKTDYNYDTNAITQAILLIYFKDSEFFDNYIEILDIENYQKQNAELIKRIKCEKLEQKLPPKGIHEQTKKI